MNSPNPFIQGPAVPTKGAPLIPAATVGAGTGGTLAAIIIYLLSLKGIFLPAGTEAFIGGLLASIGAHLPKIFQLRTGP
jgi:hypothetical protein